ncbi:MAG: MmgE/PrpD family protein [Deltaproteobacteria bacterium]|nr:MmgE/PrpD family protein [Deltaproteobacteria bacterium]
MRDASFDLAEYIVNTNYPNLSSEIIEMTRRGILDTVGVTMAASTLDPVAKEIINLVKEGGGTEESSILSFGGKVPCWMAAFANGAMGHMVDYDDMHMLGKTHPSITTVLPGLAVAERLGNVSGKDFISAVALGNDIIIRLGRAITLSPQGRDEWTMDKGWFATQLFGFISATVTAGKLLGLTADQMVNAIGIAYAQLSGNRQMGTGLATETRAIQAAWTGKGGVLSALLAQRGVTGSRDSFEGKYGLFKVYLQAEPDRDSLVGELGSRFDGINTQFKPWPACGGTHSSIYSTIELMRENNIKQDEISGIKIIGGSPHVQLLSEPIESKRRPKEAIDAKYSVPFTVAIAAVKGNVTLKDYTPDGLKDASVLEMADKISYEYLPDIAEKRKEVQPVIEITTKNGKIFSRQDDVVYGSPEKPVSKESLLKKFKDCISFSVKSIPEKNIEKFIDQVEVLEEVKDMSNIIRLLM